MGVVAVDSTGPDPGLNLVDSVDKEADVAVALAEELVAFHFAHRHCHWRDLNDLVVVVSEVDAAQLHEAVAAVGATWSSGTRADPARRFHSYPPLQCECLHAAAAEVFVLASASVAVFAVSSREFSQCHFPCFRSEIGRASCRERV